MIGELKHCTKGVHSSLAGHLEEVTLSADPGIVCAWLCTGCGKTIYNEDWVMTGMP